MASPAVPPVPNGGEPPTTTLAAAGAQTPNNPGTVVSSSYTSTITDATSPGTAKTGPSTEPQQPPTTDVPSVNNGLGAGAAAGIAIGCILVGLALGFVLAAVYFRRRHSRDHAPHHAPPILVEHKVQGPSPSSSLAQQDSLQIAQFLLDATPDKDIAGELLSLNQLIQQHVESCYHLQPVAANPAGLTQALLGLGFDRQAGFGADAIAALALDPHTRQVALRHVLSFVLFSSIDFSARSKLSMLPAPIAAFLQSVPGVERYAGNAQATATALSRWRALSAFLLHPRRSDRTALTPQENLVLPQAAGLVRALNTFLEPFVGGGGAQQQQQSEHLQAVALECAKLGYTLLSQPADWAFSHEAAQHGGGAARYLVVCAGLNKLGNKEGQSYEVARQVVPPSLVQI